MSIFTNFIRGFNEDKWWKYYEKSKNGNVVSKLVYTALYMRMANKQGAM